MTINSGLNLIIPGFIIFASLFGSFCSSMAVHFNESALEEDNNSLI